MLPENGYGVSNDRQSGCTSFLCTSEQHQREPEKAGNCWHGIDCPSLESLQVLVYYLHKFTLSYTRARLFESVATGAFTRDGFRSPHELNARNESEALYSSTSINTS